MTKKQSAFTRILKEKGTKRTILADKTGIPYSRLTTLVMNPSLEPSLSEANRIAAFFEKPVEEIFPGSFSQVQSTQSKQASA